MVVLFGSRILEKEIGNEFMNFYGFGFRFRGSMGVRLFFFNMG